MLTDESRPEGAAPEAGGPAISLPPSSALVWLDGWDAGRDVGDAEGHRRGHLEGYALGRSDGRAEAMAEIEAAEAARDEALVRAVASAASQGVPFADLAARRGDHVRAARQSATLAARGVSA